MGFSGVRGLSFTLAILIGVSFVVLLSLQLRDRLRWPAWVVGLVLGVVVVTGVVVAGTRSTAPLLWAVRDGGVGMVVLLAAGGLAFATLLRICGLGWFAALLLAEAVTLIATVSWVPRDGGLDVGSAQVRQLYACFVTAENWGTYGRYGVLYDALPNLVLYIPLGMALAATLRSRRWVALLIGLALTVGTESYQALFTDRECTGNDVLTNFAGTVVGVGIVLGLEAIAGRRVQTAANTSPR